MKNKFRKLSFAILSSTIILILTACAGSDTPTTEPITTTEAEVSTSPDINASNYLEVTDALGRFVSVEKIPERIVSGYYMSTSMLIALGLDDNLVGIESKAETRPIYKLAAPELLELPSVGTMKEFKLETCIALEPDLVILPVALSESTQGLIDVGLDVIYINPESQEQLEFSLKLIGKATGKLERAEDIINHANAEIKELSIQLKDVDKKTVYLAGNSSFLSTAGSKMYQNTLLENSNATNVAFEIDDVYWATVSNENILAYNPDFIMIAPAAQYRVDDLLNNSNFADLDAITNKQVVKMPNNVESWDSPIPASFLGSLWLASELYPDAYTFEEFQVAAKDFYQEYYGFDLTVIEVLN